MESVSNTLDNRGCLQFVDKQGASSGKRQRFPHEVNEEDDEAKNMTAQGWKHPDKITQRQHVLQVKHQALPLPDGITQHTINIREVSIGVMKGFEKCIHYKKSTSRSTLSLNWRYQCFHMSTCQGTSVTHWVWHITGIRRHREKHFPITLLILELIRVQSPPYSCFPTDNLWTPANGISLLALHFFKLVIIIKESASV